MLHLPLLRSDTAAAVTQAWALHALSNLMPVAACRAQLLQEQHMGTWLAAALSNSEAVQVSYLHCVTSRTVSLPTDICHASLPVIEVQYLIAHPVDRTCLMHILSHFPRGLSCLMWPVPNMNYTPDQCSSAAGRGRACL